MTWGPPGLPLLKHSKPGHENHRPGRVVSMERTSFVIGDLHPLSGAGTKMFVGF